LRPASYFNFVTGVMFWIGLSFEFPLVIYALDFDRLYQSKGTGEQWRLAIILIAVLAAAITPTVDPVNMALVMGPMTLLYFISIGLSRIAYRARMRQESAARYQRRVNETFKCGIRRIWFNALLIFLLLIAPAASYP
jgi:Sec-independent protein secretion pathway component TatC